MMSQQVRWQWRFATGFFFPASFRAKAAVIAGIIGCLAAMTVGCTATTVVPEPSLLFYLDPSESGSPDSASVAAFEANMAGQGCPLRVTSDSGQHASLRFSSRPLTSPGSEGLAPLLQARTHDDLPLTAAVLVKASTGIASLQNLADASIGVISDTSYLGYEIAQQMFTAAGVRLGGDKLWQTGSYDSTIVLLLHQDIFAAVLPGPLAHRWARTNNLAIVAESEPLAIGTLWAEQDMAAGLRDNCSKAFTGLQRTPFADNPMAIFPRWAEGFR